jgi:hypothetical protein
MKTLILLLSLLVIGTSFSQKNSKVTVEYKFTNIIEGYDHKTKSEFFIDGEKISESPEHLQSKNSKNKFTVSAGKHTFKMVNYTFFEGKWEVRSIDNGYSIEGTIESEINFTKKNKITVVYDINNSEPTFVVK